MYFAKILYGTKILRPTNTQFINTVLTGELLDKEGFSSYNMLVTKGRVLLKTVLRSDFMGALGVIQKLAKIGKILSKIVFIFSLIGGIFCIVGLSLAWMPQSIKIGGASLNNIVDKSADFTIANCYAALISGLIFCIGEAVIAKMAELCFKLELEKGTPFDFDVAKKLLKLGIHIIWITIVAAVCAGIARSIISLSFGSIKDMDFDGFSQISLGITFIITSLLCKCGAEQTTKNEQ